MADLNRDGLPDVIIGKYWLENPGDILNATWKMHEYGRRWTYPHVFVATGDLNGDGRLDILLSPSEKAGVVYRISWFEYPRDSRSDEWKEHVVEDNIETVHHFIGAADFDKDGQLDVATAAMGQAKLKPPEIVVYLNGGKGRKWIKNAVAHKSSHSMRIVDVNGDGLPDLYGQTGGEHKSWNCRETLRTFRGNWTTLQGPHQILIGKLHSMRPTCFRSVWAPPHS